MNLKLLVFCVGNYLVKSLFVLGQPTASGYQIKATLKETSILLDGIFVFDSISLVAEHVLTCF